MCQFKAAGRVSFSPCRQLLTGAYLPVDQICVSDHCGELGVTISSLRPFVDISAANDGQSVVHNADFGMNIHLERSLDISPQGEYMD
jgi:hypothetical protein